MQCRVIADIEVGLKEQSAKLTKKVCEHIRPVVMRNNRRWKILHFFAHIPFIGRTIFDKIREPFFLESINYPLKERWYEREGEFIKDVAKQLEKRKRADIDHYRNEIVTPSHINDPGGYYTSAVCTRYTAMQNDVPIVIPKEYDFRTAAGLDKFAIEQLVICSESLELVIRSRCDMYLDTTRRGRTYTLRR